MNKIYTENSDGSYTYDGLTFSAPESEFDAPNRFYLQMQQELAGNVEIDGVTVVASIDEYAGSDRQTADTVNQLVSDERNWRDAELSDADIEIYKLEDNAGDTTACRAYRQALREYPQQPDFPSGTRPTAPGV